MKWDEVFCNTFHAMYEQNKEAARHLVDFTIPSMPMVNACRANDYDCFAPFIAAGKLTIEQMHHAAQRYYLGKTKSGQPIYWMLDEMLTPLDAHIGNDWISTLLKHREPVLKNWFVSHCLFGLHLINASPSYPIAIVESEASAVVLSELFPERIWMAYTSVSHLLPGLLAPLEGRSVTIYPSTDPSMNTYMFFRDYERHVKGMYDINLTIDETLEDNASDSQKERCIDLLDFLLDSLQ